MSCKLLVREILLLTVKHLPNEFKMLEEEKYNSL